MKCVYCKKEIENIEKAASIEPDNHYKIQQAHEECQDASVKRKRMEKEYDNLIEKYGLVSINENKNIKGWKGKPTLDDIQTIKENKTAIIERIIERIAEKNRIEKEKQIKEYKHLEERLPPTPTFETDNDDEKARQLLQRAEKIQYYSGAESDGLNLAVSSGKQKIIGEAQKHCTHEIETQLYRGHTEDARKLLERTIECKKCKLYKKDGISDPVDGETALSM